MKKILIVFLCVISLKTFSQEARIVISVNPAYLITGNFPLTVEPVINAHFSLIAGAGITFKEMLPANEPSNLYDLFPHRKSLPGYSVNAGVRYYTSVITEAPKGFYVEGEYQYKKYSLNEEKVDDMGQHNGTYFTEHYTYNDGKLLFGYQYLHHSMTVDGFIGLGVRYASGIYGKVNYDINATNSYSYVVYSKTSILPAFAFGLKIGVAI